MYADLIEDAYGIMEKIDQLESIAEDEKNSMEIRRAVSNEIEYQKKDLNDLKLRMKNNRDGFTRIIYYRYIEGFTLDEVADELNLSYSVVAKHHADFTSYLNSPKEEREKITWINAVEFRKFLSNLESLMHPKYEACCHHCQSLTLISNEVVKKIVSTETNKARALARTKL